MEYRKLRFDESNIIREINAEQFIKRAWRDINGKRQLVEINQTLYESDPQDYQLEYALGN